MPHHQIGITSRLSLSMMLIVGIGCTERTADDPRARAAAVEQQSGRALRETANIHSSAKGDDGGGALIRERPLPPTARHVARLTGDVDLQNQYAATVRVMPHVSMGQRGDVGCNGVLIGSRLVLTAGHCVCGQQKGAAPMDERRSVIDGSMCAATAVVTSTLYEPSTQGEDLAYVNKEHKGKIRPHPELKVVLDSQDNVVSSQADLAAIFLDRPVGDELRPLALGQAEVAINEDLVIIGYGEDEAGGGIQGARRINRSKVAKLLIQDGDRIFLEDAKQRMDTDDSGGPCLRETGQGAVLVGISNRRLGKEPACTSTYASRAWLQDVLLQSGQTESVTPP